MHGLNRINTPNSLSHRVDTAPYRTQPPASLSQFNMSPEHDDKMLANASPALSGARERGSPLCRAQAKQTQACTKASHKPQPTSQFPLGFFFPFLKHTQTHTYTYESRGKMYTPQNIPRKRPFLPFCLTSVVFLMNFFSLGCSQRGACLPCLLCCSSQSKLYWRRTDRIGPGD